MKQVAKIIALVLDDPENAAVHETAKTMVHVLCAKYPIY